MQWNWQNIAVGVILILVVAWLVRALIRAVATRKYTKCGSCDDATCPYREKQK